MVPKHGQHIGDTSKRWRHSTNAACGKSSYWSDRKTNISIFHAADTTSIEAMILRHRLRWCEHATNMDNVRLPKQFLYAQKVRWIPQARPPTKAIQRRNKTTICSLLTSPQHHGKHSPMTELHGGSSSMWASRLSRKIVSAKNPKHAAAAEKQPK